MIEKNAKILIKTYPFEVMLGIISTMGILQYDNMSFFLLYEVLFIFLSFITCKRLSKEIDILFFIYCVGLTVTTAISVIASIGDNWVKRSVKGYIVVAVIALILLLFKSKTDDEERVLGYLYGLRISCAFNIGWALLQVILYRKFGLDINSLLFVKILHTTNKGSFFRGGMLGCSGLHWHPGNLAPLLVIAYLFTNNLWYKILIIIVGILTFNSTSIVGVFLCIVFDTIDTITKKDKYYRKRIIRGLFDIIFLTVFLAIIVSRTHVIQAMLPILNNFRSKITLQGIDNSANVHIGYYQALPNIFWVIKISRMLFGYGVGCSGYIFTSLFGQYENLTTWAVESDYVNNLLGTGIINTTIFLFWLIQIAIKGIKIDKKYLSLIVILLVEGFGYNIQFDWVILFLCLISFSVSKHINVFEKKNYKNPILKEISFENNTEAMF